MKKILFIIVTILLFASCVKVKYTEEEVTIPKEVYDKIHTSSVPDTLYVVETADYDYYFNQKKEVVAKYATDNEDYTEVNLIVFLVVVIVFLIIILVAALNQS